MFSINFGRKNAEQLERRATIVSTGPRRFARHSFKRRSDAKRMDKRSMEFFVVLVQNDLRASPTNVALRRVRSAGNSLDRRVLTFVQNVSTFAGRRVVVRQRLDRRPTARLAGRRNFPMGFARWRFPEQTRRALVVRFARDETRCLASSDDVQFEIEFVGLGTEFSRLEKQHRTADVRRHRRAAKFQSVSSRLVLLVVDAHALRNSFVTKTFSETKNLFSSLSDPRETPSERRIFFDRSVDERF